MSQFSSADPLDDFGRGTALSLDANTWEQVRQLAEAETGMDLSGTRFARLQDALRKVVPPGTSSAELHLTLSRPDLRVRMLERLTGQLTIGESFFFRNEHHFRVLREQVVPDILRTNAEQRQIRMWTAGCAGGEEPYSLAILLDMMLGKHASWNVSILGTDLNPEFLARAREACFRAWSFRQTDVHQNVNYFTREGDTFRLASHVRDRVRFLYLNLVKDVYPSPLTGTLGLDLILFRNVAIYLKPEVTRAIIQRFHQALRPGGWLLLGESEVSQIPTEGFTARRFGQATLHQKTSERTGLIETSAPTVLPVLANVATTMTIPGVPSVPDWVPLPARRTNPSNWNNRPVQTSPVSSGLPLGQASAWHNVERSLSQRDFVGAELLIERLPTKSDRASVRLRYVRALMAAAEIARARQSLELCLRDDPMLIEAQFLNACFAEEAGELELAEQAFRRALYVDRNCAMAHFHLALVQQQKGDLSGAKRSLQTTLKLVDGKEPHDLVEFGEGICYGRLREMISLLVSDS